MTSRTPKACKSRYAILNQGAAREPLVPGVKNLIFRARWTDAETCVLIEALRVAQVRDLVQLKDLPLEELPLNRTRAQICNFVWRRLGKASGEAAVATVPGSAVGEGLALEDAPLIADLLGAPDECAAAVARMLVLIDDGLTASHQSQTGRRFRKKQRNQLLAQSDAE
jgi:hypothetical protein